MSRFYKEDVTLPLDLSRRSSLVPLSDRARINLDLGVVLLEL